MITLAEHLFFMVFIINFLLVYVGFLIYFSIKEKHLGTSLLFFTLCILFFGLHHVLELTRIAGSFSHMAAEWMELLALALLTLSIYSLFKSERKW